jgi:1,4-dihydroxy-2-naphthoate octaprenyltransferase
MSVQAASPPHPSLWQVWFRAVRPWSFTTSTIPIIAASALSLYDHALDPLALIVMLLASMLTHAGCNMANDYYDHRRGIDMSAIHGPSGVIQHQWLTPAQVLGGAIVSFALATVLGLWIVAMAGWPIFWLALASLAAAYLYTGGPAPLGYLALGEVTVFIFMGPGMIGGAYYVNTGHLTAASLLLGAAIGFLAAAILHANNVRDIERDRGKGKRTIAILTGRRGSTIEYALLLALTYASIVAMIAVQPGVWPVVLVGATIPAALRLCRKIAFGETTADLNLVLRKTAGLHLQFGALAIAGLLVATALERWR